MGQNDVNGLRLKKMGLGGAKGRNEQWSPVVSPPNTLRYFGPHFFHKCRINARLISNENRLKYLSIHIWLEIYLSLVSKKIYLAFLSYF